jgi:hypothetical protein
MVHAMGSIDFETPRDQCCHRPAAFGHGFRRSGRLLIRISEGFSTMLSPTLFTRPLILFALLASTLGPCSLKSEIVFQRTAARADGVVVAPYPAPGTNFLSWFSAGSPGAWITTFEPATNEIIRSVTIEMADAVTGSEPLAGDAAEGGFSLNLCQIQPNESGGASIEIIAVLEGSDNPAREGSYTYTVPEGLELRGPHALLAMVEPSGGFFRWKTNSLEAAIGTGSGAGLIFTPGSNTPTIDNPLDLENVVIFVGDNFAPAFTVEADDRPADLTLTPAKRFAPTTVGEESRSQRITIRNSGISPLTGLAVRGDAEARRHFDFTQPRLRSLTAGATTDFTVSFRPRGSGRISGALTVVSSVGTAKIRLRGRGVTPPVQPPVREPRNVE